MTDLARRYVPSRIVHQEGTKDPFQVSVRFERPVPSWEPTNRELFSLLDHYFHSEDHEFGYGEGRRMPWVFITAIYYGRSDLAIRAADEDEADVMRLYKEARQVIQEPLRREVERLRVHEVVP